MELNEYQKLCAKTAKKFKRKDDAINCWALGVSGEAGDMAGCIKKTLFHGNNQKAGTRENVGDVMWYLAMICNYYGWNLEDILNENVEKLKARYPKGFTEKAAKRGKTRVDWMEK